MTDLNTSNINRIWADLLVEELIRAGAGIFCIAPGSRSTPLATAIAANARAEHVIHFDERGTAFFALGYSRATHRPAVWVTTSGTAVANGLPAVVEASLDGIPLLLLTADRPPELRDTGANQTIDQVKIFGDYVRWQFDLPVPDQVIDPAVVLTTVDQAVYRARRMPSGPVHLNCMFREPLAPDPDGRSYDEYVSALSSWRQGARAYTHYTPVRLVPGEGEIDRLRALLRTVRRGLVVAGRLDTPAQADAVRWLAERLGWPVLPDIGSQMRLGGVVTATHAVPNYDLALTSPEFRARCAPEAVLHVGGRATSKRLTEFIAGSSPTPYVVVRESPARLDPNHRVTEYVEADIVSFCREMVAAVDGDGTGNPEWVRTWMETSRTVAERIDLLLAGDLTEPSAARTISGLVPQDSGLFLASSMPVRDMDMYGSQCGSGPRVGSNRGASGIDGTIASAVGFGHGLRARVTVMAGDLALLHDLNSLALFKNSRYPVVVVAINNHGGGIFSFLPIAKHRDVFEPYFGTPHELSFNHAAAMFGIDYSHVAALSELEDSYRKAIASGKSCLIEITTDRAENVRLHRRIEEAVSQALA